MLSLFGVYILRYPSGRRLYITIRKLVKIEHVQGIGSPKKKFAEINKSQQSTHIQQDFINNVIFLYLCFVYR